MTHSACILIIDSTSVWCGPTGHPSLVAQLVKNLPAVQETWVWSTDWKDPLEKEMATHSSILAWKSHGQKRLVGCSPWGHKELGTTGQLTLTYLLKLVGKVFCLVWRTSVLFSTVPIQIYIPINPLVGLPCRTMTNLGSILKSRDITLPTKAHQSKLCFFQ